MSLSPALSVIVPAFNEEALLGDAIRRLHRVLSELSPGAEIIIVNDGSRDQTADLANQLARELPGVVAVHQENQGIGGAFRTGAARATGEYLILWPADMPAEPDDLAPYLAQFGRADVIVGCRRQRVGYNPLMLVNAWLYPKLVAVLFDLRVRDVNWIHAYRREAFLGIRLTQRGIPMLAEALVRLRDAGAKFAEVEVDMKARLGGVPSASRVRVMWRTLTGLFLLWTTWRREQRPPALADSRLARGLVLGLAAVAAAIWLWSHTCQFPAMVWNDIRVAPAVALAQGLSVYPTGEHGAINTWTYGPLPLLYLWPASWAASAPGALQIASVLNLALILAPLALVCFTWPAPGDPPGPAFGRITAFILCVVAWPEEFYALFYADSVALACGLLGNLLLVRTRTPQALWFAAIATMAALACKQTALGIPLAQVIWLGRTAGWKAAGRQALRCVVAGAGIAALAIAFFGWAGLWFVLVELPANFPWFPEPMKRLWFVAADLALYLGLPGLIMVWQRRAFLSRPALLLPALAWVCAIPPGLMALLKLGGRTNSLYSFPLWLPLVATALLTSGPPGGFRRWIPLGAAVAASALACLRLLEAPRLPLQPQVAAYREAEQFTAQLRGRIWFPFHPLITLYGEGRYYHDEDGLFVWRASHRKVSAEQAAAHLPPAMQVIALRNGWNDWGVARSMLPPNARSTVMGDWTLWHGPADHPSSR